MLVRFDLDIPLSRFIDSRKLRTILFPDILVHFNPFTDLLILVHYYMGLSSIQFTLDKAPFKIPGHTRLRFVEFCSLWTYPQQDMLI